MAVFFRLLGPGLMALALGACAAPQATGLKSIPATGNVIGASEQVIIQSLGDPQFKRKDPPAEIWQYTTRECVLLLFLYPAQDHTEVRHSAAQSRKGRNYPPGDCVEQVIAARAKPLPASAPAIKQ